MSTSWTLTVGAVTKSLAAWGVSSATLEFRSRDADTLTLRLDGTLADANPVFAYGAEATLTKHVTDDEAEPPTTTDTTWFVGTCTTLHRSSAPSEESHEYQFAGPWWRLGRQVFMQDWQMYRGGSIQNTPMPDLLLNIDEAGLPLSTQDQIAAVITWAASCGISVQNPDPLDYPLLIICVDEARDLFCTDVIQRELRWAPDAVTWFDYTTTPPTFRCLQRPSLSSVSLALWDLENHESIQITRRDDLTITEAYLVYSRRDNVDDTPTNALFVDIYPPASTGQSARPLVASIDLEGYSSSSAKFHVESATLPATSGTEATRIAWWQLKEPLFSSPKVKSTTLHITSATLYDESGNDITSSLATWPYELIDGQIPVGMTFSGNPAAVMTATVKAVATYSLYLDDAQKQLSEVRRKELSCRVKLTNVPTGDYKVMQTSTAGEDPPSGLASALYTSLGTAQFEGSVVYTQDEVTGLVRPGNKLNLTGGRAEWATMDAAVQSVREDIVTGRTTVNFGPAPKFSLQDFLELLRATRARRVWTNPEVRVTGTAGNRDSVALGKTLPRENTTSGLGGYNVHTVAGEPDGSSQRVQIQAHATDSHLTISRIDADADPVSGKGKIVLALADCIKADETEKEVRIREKGGGLVMCSPDFTPGGSNIPVEYDSTATYDRGAEVGISDPGPHAGSYVCLVDGTTSTNPPWEGGSWYRRPIGFGPYYT